LAALLKATRQIAGKNLDDAKANAALCSAAAECGLHSRSTKPRWAARQPVPKISPTISAGSVGPACCEHLTRHMPGSRRLQPRPGKGFMSYKIALARLRLALVPLLMNGGGLDRHVHADCCNQHTSVHCKLRHLFDRQNISVLVSSKNEDDFVRHLCTILCEFRLAFVVKCPQNFITGSFP
jgi:hypothetical protein